MKNINLCVRRALAGALALLIVGCATTPADEGAAPSPTPPPGSGRIVFFRTSNIFGFSMRSDIVLNERFVGRSAPATKFSVDVPPGVHHVSIPNSVYSGTHTLQVPVKAGEIVYVRTWIGSSSFAGGTEAEVVSTTEGKTETDKMDTSKAR